MMTRELPQHEWTRLAGTDIAEALPFHNPEDVHVIVVEDGDKIVGAWAVLRVVQLEGVWIDPAYRKRGTVAGRLLNATMRVAKSLAPCMAFTGSTSEDVSELLTTHLGAVRLPMDPYVIPLGAFPCR
jgi:hypothetical protein